MPTEKSTPETPSPAAVAAPKKARGHRNLLNLRPSRVEPEDKPELARPVEEMDGKTPSLSLGFTTDDMEYIFPYIAFQTAVRMGQQFSLAVGEYVVNLMIDDDLAVKNGWQTPAQDITNGLHAQTIKWLYHRPEAGLTITVDKNEQENEGGGG